MKAMIVSDFAVLRSALLQLLGICAIIALFMGYVMGAVGTAAAIAAMVPFMGLFSLAAYDEQNNWERFRLTLPLTRRQVVFGRDVYKRQPETRLPLLPLNNGYVESAAAQKNKKAPGNPGLSASIHGGRGGI